MGEAKRRQLADALGTGNGFGHRITQKRIRVVANIRIETLKDQRGVIMMLGDTEPELATGMTPEQARQLAAALIQHAEQAEIETPKIIIPGGIVTPTQGGQAG